MIQPPGDVHGTGAVVPDVVCRAEVGIRLRAAGDSVGFEFPHEQQHTAAFFFMVDIPLSGRGVLRSGALALPMEQLAVDGVIVIHRGGRIMSIKQYPSGYRRIFPMARRRSPL